MNFSQLINQLSAQDPELPLLLLNDKLNKLSRAYPEDKTLGSVARVVADVKGDFIRQSDLKGLYHQLHSFGTKFAELFQEELGEKPAEPTLTIAPRDESLNVQPYQVQDQILAHALESVFDKQMPLKMYSKLASNQAIKLVSHALDSWNLHPAQLTVSEGNDQFIIVKADYETPKGLTSFFVPIEVHHNQAISPEVFVGNAGPEDLNHLTIKTYLTSQAGTKNKIGGADLLKVLTSASSEQREISATELAMTRLHAVRQGQADFFQGQVVGLTVEASAQPDVSMPRMPEAYSFEKEFDTPKGQAFYQFGSVVDIGRNHIARQLQSFGFMSPQVIITGHDNHTIFYGVALDTGKTSFTVPVKVANQQIVKPEILLCNGSISSFDLDGINELVSNNKTDVKISAFASSFATLKPSEVISNLRQAVVEGNLAKAEDALNVLANCHDDKAYMTGLHAYMNGLSGKKLVKSECPNMIKSANSEYPVCSHTGLPINKIYQDKQGFCRPMFRQGMEETYEGAMFMNAKVFG